MASESDARRPVVCDVGAFTSPDASSIDGLARLQLAARRQGCQIEFRGARSELIGLLDLVGLREVLPMCGELGLEPPREAEEREQARRVEEEADAGDPTV